MHYAHLLLLKVGGESHLEQSGMILCDDIYDLTGDPGVDRVLCVEHFETLSGCDAFILMISLCHIAIMRLCISLNLNYYH